MGSEGGEIAFVDVETTVPLRQGQGFALLEFGAILVCPRKLVEVGSYSTLIRPHDLSLVSPTSIKCNGITREAVSAAPTFRDVADEVYNILHGRVWAGHNIVRFDCLRIREAFAEIGRPPPEPKGTIDSLPLLTQKFGRRAGNMKMASLAAYFGLGQQKHRSLDDVRMNLEVLKYCATVLFLESSYPDIFPSSGLVSPMAATGSHINGNASMEGTRLNLTSPSVVENGNVSGAILSPVESNSFISKADPVDLASVIDQMKIDTSLPNATMDERPTAPEEFPGMTTSSEGSSGHTGFLDPDVVSIPSIHASLVPAYRGSSKIVLLHKDVLLQLCCTNLRVRFGVSSKFQDHSGRPRLSIVVDAPQNLCHVLDACDHLAQKLSLESGSSSEWKPLVTRRNGFFNSTVRLNIPTVANGATATYSTEMFQKEPSGSTQRLVFSRIDAAELDLLFVPGTPLDAHFSLEVYDYQQLTGIRLVAKRLIVHCKQE